MTTSIFPPPTDPLPGDGRKIVVSCRDELKEELEKDLEKLDKELEMDKFDENILEDIKKHDEDVFIKKGPKPDENIMEDLETYHNEQINKYHKAAIEGDNRIIGNETHEINKQSNQTTEARDFAWTRTEEKIDTSPLQNLKKALGIEGKLECEKLPKEAEADPIDLMSELLAKGYNISMFTNKSDYTEALARIRGMTLLIQKLSRRLGHVRQKNRELRKKLEKEGAPLFSHVKGYKPVDMVSDVYAFRTKFKQPCPQQPVHVDRETRDNHKKFMMEEVTELMTAYYSEEVLDAYVDIIYVAIGRCLERGWDIEEAWRRVHQANMAKVLDKDKADPHKDCVAKPEGWKPPDLSDIASVPMLSTER